MGVLDAEPGTERWWWRNAPARVCAPKSASGIVTCGGDAERLPVRVAD
jgi:hypothetical protein